MVRKARDRVFHLNCFVCLVCRKQLLTGDQLYVMRDGGFVCQEDYLAGAAGGLNGGGEIRFEFKG